MKIVIIGIIILLIAAIISRIKDFAGIKAADDDLRGYDNFTIITKMLRNSLDTFVQKKGEAYIQSACTCVSETIAPNNKVNINDGEVPFLVVMPHMVGLIHIIDAPGTLELGPDDCARDLVKKYKPKYPNEFLEFKWDYQNYTYMKADESALMPGLSSLYYDMLTDSRVTHIYMLNKHTKVSNELKNKVAEINKKRPHYIEFVTYDLRKPDTLHNYRDVLIAADNYFSKYKEFGEDDITCIVNRATMSTMTNAHYDQYVEYDMSPVILPNK